MEQGGKINIQSKLHQEEYSLTWSIENFGMMPFCDNHPVCGPCFLLGKHRDTTWSLLMSKQMHEGVENVGFRLVRAEDETSWNMVKFSLYVKMEDGRSVKCIDKEILGGESQSQYVFMIRPSKTKPALKNGIDASSQAESSSGMEESVKALEKETCCTNACEVKSAMEGAIPKAKPESCGSKYSEVKTHEVQQDDAELKAEELLKIETLTVVCTIEYTYIICIKEHEKAERVSIESDLMDTLKRLYANEEFSDCTVVCEKIRIRCHKAILCLRSKVFHEKLTSKKETPDTVELDMQLHIAKAFILYLYTSEFPDGMLADDFKELCNVAERFEVRGMHQRCLELMKLPEYEEGEVDLDKASQSLYSIVSPLKKKQSLVTDTTDVAVCCMCISKRVPITLDPTDVTNSSTQTSTSG